MPSAWVQSIWSSRRAKGAVCPVRHSSDCEPPHRYRRDMTDLPAPQSPTLPPPGWYPAPNMASTNRYWDGRAWTDHVAPVATAGGAPASAASPSGIVALGYISAILLPIVGFVIGLTQINRKGGVGIILVSILSFIVWYALLTS
jgi:hypothetical protein